MESKSNKSSSALLFGLSFNLILTLGSLGFTCYSLNGLDSRLTAVEHDLLVVNHPYQLANGKIVEPTSTHSSRSGSRRKEAVAKRAVDRPSMCRKCSSPCLNANRPRNVSCISLHVIIANVVQMQWPVRLGDPLLSEQNLIPCPGWVVINRLFLELKWIWKELIDYIRRTRIQHQTH